ncbi:MAG: penicillin acylase family protein [Anaerolineae bacterium]|jgi:penicillin amidase|nr:penicillin acylase family protein [Anaerolineae bacterium]MBT4310220.1 penicillin acylase family protein [Anaerolineae bacterium]MBT4460023.1 penicillin acylase family protein [Anaerolineae bacterium]MBT4842200.1 penicillin acylase family protein [Anaerolineae bacterium]MBT6061338.1 penicillin acylase family protein [Anaerolineae bacterium]
MKAKITRDENGTPHIEAQTLKDMYWGQGFAHARDRGVQMLMMRILGQGRLCELLNDSDESLDIDKFFRQMNWHNNLKREFDKLEGKYQGYLQSYAEGVNAAFAEKTPWEYKLLGYKPSKWTATDSIMISRMVGYLTLAQSQAEMERLFVEMVQADISQEKLEELFPGNLGELDIELLKKVQLGERIVNPSSLWDMGAPRMMASNNWVIGGTRTKSGMPIVANDPHLEVNRLPNVWSEIVLSSGDSYVMGGTMPGAPGVLTGRNPKLGWGVTYAFVDAVDSWIEDCKDGQYRKEGEWHNFEIRTEIIKRKKADDVEVKFYENEHGVLDGDPHRPGLYLATRWTGADSGAVTFRALFDIAEASTTKDGMDIIGQVETGWDFVLGDVGGDIGFQMTGKVPKRRAGISGFVPLPGWDAKNDWREYIQVDEMPRSFNPKSNFFATANHDLNEYGKIPPINMPMGSYRAERINALLAKKDDFAIEDIFAMHADVYSLQAERFMAILRPILSTIKSTENTEKNLAILLEWDLCYDVDSQGAYLFEAFYKELYREVFGKNGFGTEALDFLYDESGTFIDFYQNFDRVLLAKNSSWFGEMSRDEVFSKVAMKSLNIEAKTWGSRQQYTMSHMLFGGTLPAFLGFDRGPITGVGGRATINQGQIYQSAGRTTTFFPSLRMAMDLVNEKLYSNLAGGPSDNRFSKWYVSDLENWLNYRYKVTKVGDGDE